MSAADSSTDDQLIELVHATRSLGRFGYERVELHYNHVGNYAEACVVSVVDGDELVDPVPDEVVTLVLRRRISQHERSGDGVWMSYVLVCWMDGLVEEHENYDNQPRWLAGHPTEHDFILERERFPRASGFPAWLESGALLEPLMPEAKDRLVIGSSKARALCGEIGVEAMHLYHEALVRSMEVQEHVMSLVGAAGVEVDLEGRAAVTFTAATSIITARAHVLGTTDATSSETPGRWRWAWSEPDAFAPSSIQFSRLVRNFGEAEQVPGLCTPELPLNEVLHPRATALLLLVASKPITGVWAHFALENERGETVALLLEHPDFEVGRHPIDVTAQYALAATLNLTVTDHRALISGYAKHVADVEFVAESESLLLWRAPEGEVAFDLDDSGRVVAAQFTAALTADEARGASVLGLGGADPVGVAAGGAGNGGAASGRKRWLRRWLGR
ncbi:hypothetical protein JT358_13625 [Micrococcales bacterium 31B]|nr:hypothetical protein [Micrococcales bacterium 31B]